MSYIYDDDVRLNVAHVLSNKRLPASQRYLYEYSYSHFDRRVVVMAVYVANPDLDVCTNESVSRLGARKMKHCTLPFGRRTRQGRRR